jgi:outer membrane protein TolC
VEKSQWLSAGILSETFKKMTSNKKIISLLLIIFFGFKIHGQVVMSYDDFLSIVKQGNPLAKRASNNKEYGKRQFKAAKGNFDPQINSSIENKQFNSIHYFTVGSAEIRQPLYTSQYLKAGVQYGQGLFLNPENSTAMTGLPYVGIQASVLQGLVIDRNRAEVMKGKYYVDFYDAEEKIQLNELLYESSQTYFEYLYLKRVIELFSYFASLADQRLKGITELSLIGERPTVDTIEASIFLQGRILDQQAGELERIRKFNEMLLLLQNQLPAGNTFAVSDSIESVYSLIRSAVVEQLMRDQLNNPLISQYLAKQGILETEAKLRREMIKPILDINYNFLNNDISNIFPNPNLNNYKWGASFSLPLFLRKPRNEYKMANLNLQNNEFELTNKQNQLDFKRKFILDAIQLTSQQIITAERSASYSKLLVEAERLKFNNGESSLFLLNARENRWLEAELKLAEYKLKYIKTYVELIYNNGSLQYELITK